MNLIFWAVLITLYYQVVAESILPRPADGNKKHGGKKPFKPPVLSDSMLKSNETTSKSEDTSKTMSQLPDKAGASKRNGTVDNVNPNGFILNESNMKKPVIFSQAKDDEIILYPTDPVYPYYPYYYEPKQPSCCQADVFEALCNNKVEPLLQNLVRLNGQIYYFSPLITATNPGLNWYQAQDFCRRYGMQLVSTETKAEEVAVRDYVTTLLAGVSSGSFWTSLNDLSVEGTYMWAGVGEPAWTIPFASISPNGVTADCGEIIKYSNIIIADPLPSDPKIAVKITITETLTSSKVVWNDQNCMKKSRFICEAICPCDELINII